MKTETEDYQEDVDPFLALLVTLWTDNLSVNIKVETDSLFVHPQPDEFLSGDIMTHWEQLAHWLPGVCDACSLWSLQRSALPFGASAHLCFKCRDKAIEVFEKHGWPSPLWYRHEKA